MEDRSVARCFLGVGVALAVIGLAIWFKAPVHPMFPPYLITAALAVGYGLFSRRDRRP
jgi:hypothetical protein